MNYVLLVVLLLIAGISVADETDPEDLGVITENVGVGLTPCKTRKDFHHFVIEFLPQLWPTNKVTVTTTNLLLQLDDLTAVPHGPALMGIKSVCIDGSESSIKVYKIDIRRDAPTAPKATRVHIMRRRSTNSTEQLLNGRRYFHTLTNQLPPIPGQTNKPTTLFPGPLPNGEPKTYSQHIDEMREYYSRGQSAPHKSAL